MFQGSCRRKFVWNEQKNSPTFFAMEKFEVTILFDCEFYEKEKSKRKFQIKIRNFSDFIGFYEEKKSKVNKIENKQIINC